MGVQEEEAQGVGRVLFEGLAQRDDVAQGLAHLLVAQFDHTVVHPELRHRRIAGARLGLGDLVFVVRKDEILSAAVDVDVLSEVLRRHGAALDVPSRPSLAPGAVPRGFAGLLCFPQGEVEAVPLPLIYLDTRADAQAFDVTSAQPAVAGVAADVEVDVALRLVGDLIVDHGLDHLDDLGDLLGGSGVEVGGKDVESLHLIEIEADVALCQVVDGFAFRDGAVDHLVVYIGEVFDELDLVAAELQVAPEHVEDDRPHGVSDVGLGVGREAADVHADHAV